MRILMVTDAWRPQVNGVVHTLERLTETLKSFDVAVDFLTPNSEIRYWMKEDQADRTLLVISRWFSADSRESEVFCALHRHGS